MEKKIYKTQKRHKFKKNTILSQTSNSSINNTSISTPNISIINSIQNKTSLIKSNSFSEDNQKNIKNNKDKIKLFLSNSSNKKKKASIPFRKKKNNKSLINSNILKNNNEKYENSIISKNRFDSKNNQDNPKIPKRSFDNEFNRDNYYFNFNNLKEDSIDNTSFKNKKNNFSFSVLNSELNLDNNTNIIERSILRSKTKKISYSGKKTNLNSKLNLYSIKSFNAAKLSWSNENKNINNKKIFNVRKFNKTQNKFNKSFFYKNKKLNVGHEKFEKYKHFSPLVKYVNKSNYKNIPNRDNFLNNKLKKTDKHSPIKNDIKKSELKTISIMNKNEKNIKNVEIKMNANNYNLSKLPLIDIKNNNNNSIKNSKPNYINIDNNIKLLENNQDKKNINDKIDDLKPKIVSNSFKDINFVLDKNVEITNFTINNLRLTKKINDNLEKRIDNTHCVYCLKRVIKPIELSCGHELCLSCAEEIISLYKFIHIPYIEPKFIKCPKCKKKSDIIDNNLNNMLRLNWYPSQPYEQNEIINNSLDEQKIMEKKLQLCEICPNSKYIRDLAEFECLNCDIILCYECRIRHLSNPRHQDHKIIPYTKILQEKVELSLCDKHREPTKLFCETCMKSICVICAQYDKDHENHKINTIKNILDNQTIELTGNMRVCEVQIKIIEELIDQMIYSKQKLEEEKKIFLDDIKKTIDKIINLINNKKEELINYINQLFGNKLENLENKLTNFKLVKNRYQYYRGLICDRDIDIIDRVIQIKKLNKKILKIENLGLLNSSNFNKSFSQSLFINEPYKEIEKILKKYSFLPITDLTMENIIKIFNNSNIIKKEFIYRDFIVILPKIKSGLLLYSTLIDGVSTITFHKKCDNKGPTLTIVKTVDGHIFGGYNPRSWVSESMYNECDNSFIFSLSDGKTINPIKCPLIEYKKSMAIYQNEELNSPGWGEVSEADLFISYKNLENSYSNLGRCYKAPKNYEPNCFLAGKPSQWEIELVEVYAVEIISDEEYYKMMLN